MKIHLKKVFVSLLVIIGFVFYGFYQRFGDGLQKYFDNLQTRQVAAETYSVLDASSSKNQTSANPPLNISKSTRNLFRTDRIFTGRPGQYSCILKMPIIAFIKMVNTMDVLLMHIMVIFRLGQL